jgi:hypothetical protein
MKDKAKFLRRELDRIGTRRGRCIPPQLRARASRWISAGRAEGRKVAALAAELGIASGTALRWSNEGARAMVPVHIVAEERPTTVAIVSPSRFRIEGLSLADAVRVLRELG